MSVAGKAVDQQAVSQDPQPEGQSPRDRLLAVIRYRGLPVLIGTLVLWVLVAADSHGHFGGAIESALTVGAFLSLVGLGQMFVIASGSGNIDLSVPYVLTFGAYLAGQIIDGGSGSLVLAIVATIAFGLCVGIANSAVVMFLNVPPIVATLAVGFIVESGYLELGTHVSNLSGNASNPLGSAVSKLATGRFGGFSYMAVVMIVCVIVAQIFLWRSWFARRLLAMGQSPRAAKLSGVPINLVTVIAYCISGVMAAAVGVLLGGYIGGGSLDMGTSYQLGSVAVVILGGCFISGGVANAPGVGIAALFLTLLITLTDILHVSVGVQQVIEGAIIVALLSVVGSSRNAD
jgi:ribose transport system permease protein